MHQIQRQIIEVQVHGGGDGFRWQQHVERVATGSLTGRLEALLDQYNSPDTLVIDRLQLDLGQVDEGTFEEEFLKAVEKELSQRLGQLRVLPIESRSFTVFDTFLYFLESGTLPWWADETAYRRFVQEAEMPESWNAYGPEHFAKLTETLRTHPQAFHRLREQFTELFLIQLTILLFQKKDPRVFTRWFLFQRIVQDYRLLSPLDSARYFYTKLIENLVFIPDAAGDFFVQILYKTLADANLKAQVLTTLSPGSWENFLNEVEQKFGQASFQPASTGNSIKKVSQDPSPVEEEKEIQDEESEQYYIANAGLVLLAPFLTEYLKNCEAANDSRILDPDAAVHLIQYLATGQAATPEYELVLNKVLCGLPVPTPVCEGIVLTEGQRQEAGDVLESVLRYWPVMKNTSREGLRASFLQRPARLSRRQPLNADSVSNAVSVHSSSWLLQVEQTSYDLLLSELPWGYNPVALPWMPSPIWVEWS